MGENGMYRILVCDDERDIVSALRIYLTAEGYEVLEAYNGSEMLRLAATQEVHLILLDVMMPGMDGLSAMAELRRTSNVPVILLTAKSEDTDKVLGLNLGADDYVTKPFNPIEVMARVRSQLRRYLQLGGGQVLPTQVTIGGIMLDDNKIEKLGRADADGVRHPASAHAACGHSLLSARNLSPCLGRFARRRGERRGGAHPASALEDRD